MGQIIAKAQKTVLLVTDSLLVQASGGTTNRVTANNILSAAQAQDATINGLTVGRGGGNVVDCVALGTNALSTNTGADNVSIGYLGLTSNVGGYRNVGVGRSVLFANISGYENSAYGFGAGRYHGAGTAALTSTIQGTYLGGLTRASADGNTNEIVIGYNAVGNGSNSVTLGNSSIALTVLRGTTAIGTVTPNANAILDVVSTTKAFMPPRMTTVQRDAIASPGAGMVVYNTTTNVLNFHNGTAWGAV